MTTDHNQSIGFGRYSKTSKEGEEFRRGMKKENRIVIKEVTIKDAIKQLLSLEEIKKVYKVIGGGKEATVVLAETIEEEIVCAKIFRYFTSTIKKRMKGTKHILESDMAALAAMQEYWNLVEMQNIIPVPKPIMLKGNIVVMEFINQKEESLTPAPLLKDYNLDGEDYEEYLHESIDILARLFLEGNYIHGDYSEHNLMITENQELVTMDVSQSVKYNIKTFINTPLRIRIDSAIDFLKVDIKNINNYFKKNYRIALDVDEIIDSITKELPQHLQNYLNEKTEEIYPAGLVPRDSFVAKEDYRNDLILNRTGTKRQRPK